MRSPTASTSMSTSNGFISFSRDFKPSTSGSGSGSTRPHNNGDTNNNHNHSNINNGDDGDTDDVADGTPGTSAHGTGMMRHSTSNHSGMSLESVDEGQGGVGGGRPGLGRRTGKEDDDDDEDGDDDDAMSSGGGGRVDRMDAGVMGTNGNGTANGRVYEDQDRDRDHHRRKPSRPKGIVHGQSSPSALPPLVQH